MSLLPFTKLSDPRRRLTSRFSRAVPALASQTGVVLLQAYKAGEKMLVDWEHPPFYDPNGGTVKQAHLFVAVLNISRVFSSIDRNF